MTWIMETEEVDYDLNIKRVTGGWGGQEYRLWSQKDVDSNPDSISYQLCHSGQGIWHLSAIVLLKDR